jgi:hypothetical protein
MNVHQKSAIELLTEAAPAMLNALRAVRDSLPDNPGAPKERELYAAIHEAILLAETGQ